MEDTTNRDCRILFDVLIGQGLQAAVLSPGSRNAPLLIAASARPELKSHIVTDERTAGFIALGIAVASQQPVMLCCTSGTAMYNYAPAVAEAMYQKIPLIVVTADRPARWIDQDDSQTLRQPSALANIVKRSFNITTAEGAGVAAKGERFGTEREWYVNRTVNEAWIAATTDVKGPVHINIQLDTPLTGTQPRDLSERQRVVNVVNGAGTLSAEVLRHRAAHMAGRKVLVTTGFMQPDHRLSRALGNFLTLPNTALCAEPISNLHTDGEAFRIDSLLHPRGDAALERSIKKRLRPDIVISIGGALVSRMLKDFLREYQPEEIYTLGDTDPGVDCFQGLTTHFNVSPTHFLRGIASMTRWLGRRGELPVDVPRYGAEWHEMRQGYCNSPVSDPGEWSELMAFNEIFRTLPADYNLFLSNGTPVRYGGICLNRMPHAVYANRGVSGIEGTTATAVGIAMQYRRPTLLITGDMSFGYNPQILGLDLVPSNFKIIVVDNAGGGIFRFISSTRDLAQREEYFCVSRPQPIEALAEAYGWQYFRADSPESLQEVLPRFYAATTRAIMTLHVDPATSADALVRYLS